MFRRLSVALLVVVIFGGFHSLATEGNSPSSSVRALDKFGNAQELQNAQKAADLHGTLVVAAHDASKDRFIVLSLLEGGVSSMSSAIISKPSMLHLTNNNPAFLGSGRNHQPQTAMVCTGLKADANWLLSTVRRYSHRVWSRYNSFVDATAVAQAVSKYFRSFWGYDQDEEWIPTELAKDFDEDRGTIWGRPLGVVAMVLSSSLPFLLVVGPSGIIQRYNAFAMGKNSNEILEKLGDSINDGKDQSREYLKDRLIDLILSTVPSSSKRDASILVEILSDEGIERFVHSNGNVA